MKLFFVFQLTQICVKELLIDNVIELNEYRADTDFRILRIAFKINCARTETNLAKIHKHISIINADFTANEFFEDHLELEIDKDLVVFINATDTFRALQALIRLIRYLKESRSLYDA